MLVNIRKLLFHLILIFGGNSVLAQETLTLNQCITTALAHNKTLQINRNNISISEQQAKEAKASLIPKITANADYKYIMEIPTQLMPTNALNPQAPEGQFRNVQFGVPHNINANFQLAMPVYNPQVYGAIENTKIANELAQLQFQKSEEQVLYDITSLYYHAQMLKHQLEFLETNLDNSNKLLRNIQVLKEQLLAKGSDEGKVQLQTDQLQTQKEIALNNYNQILNAIKLTMGVELEKEIGVESEIPFQNLPDYTLQKFLDIQLVQTKNKLLYAELGTLKRSRFLPSVNLIASYGTSGFGYDKSPNEFLKFYGVGFVGLQLSYPLFNGTATQRKINQKKLEISNNELQMQLMNEKVKMDIANSSRQKQVAAQTVFNTEKQIALAQSIYNQTILQQKQGIANLTDILLADNALREAQQIYLSAIIEYLKADLELKKITGTIKNEELEIKNKEN